MKPVQAEVVALLREGAGQVFSHGVRRLHALVDEEPPRGLDPLLLLQRLMDRGRLEPEAALYLLAIGRALRHAGAVPAGGGPWLRRVVERGFDGIVDHVRRNAGAPVRGKD